MKKNFKLVWDELVRGGFFTSICAIATLYSASIILNKPVMPVFAILVFLITIAIYFFNFIGEVDDDMRDDRREQIKVKNYKNVYLILVLVSIIFSVYIILQFGTLSSKYFGIAFIALGVLYTLGLKKISKNIIGFKDIFVILSWNLLIPFFYIFHKYTLDLPMILFMAFALSRDWINANYCDLKDYTIDKNDGINTFANSLGIPRLTTSIYISSVASLLILLSAYYFNIFPKFTLILVIPIISTLAFILHSKRIKDYSTLYVDSEPFFWLAFLILIKYL